MYLIKLGEKRNLSTCGSVAQWYKRETLGSSPSRATLFLVPVSFGGQYGSVLDPWVCERDCFVGFAWFRADSGPNLIKQGENVTGRYEAW